MQTNVRTNEESKERDLKVAASDSRVSLKENSEYSKSHARVLSQGEEPKSSRRAWCLVGSNSHKLQALCSQGRIRRTNITWTTSTSLIFLSSISLTRVWSSDSLLDED